jgi:hypothetical protein
MVKNGGRGSKISSASYCLDEGLLVFASRMCCRLHQLMWGPKKCIFSSYKQTIAEIAIFVSGATFIHCNLLQHGTLKKIHCITNNNF